MRTKDHYEMREYNIDVLDGEKESDIHGEVRPYPLYPSKGGMNPTLLRDIISRSVLCSCVLTEIFILLFILISVRNFL